MSRTTTLNYATIANACSELLQSGEKPSLKKLHKRLGGSFSTILPFYQQWQETQSLADKTNEDLSPEFRQAALAEFGRITLKTSQRFIAELNAKSEELRETQKLLIDSECKIEQLTEDLTLRQEKAQQEHLKFEKNLSALQALVDAGADREAALQNQIETLRQALHKAELKTAVAEALYQKKVALNKS